MEHSSLTRDPNEIGETALVVLGAPRSGTTLLATALAAHPGISLLSEDCEGGVFRLIGGKLPAVKLCTPVHVDLDRRWSPLYEPLRRSRWLRRNFNYRLPRSRLSLRDMAAEARLKVVCLLRDPARSLDALARHGYDNDRVRKDILRRTYRIYERVPAECRMDSAILSFDRFVRAPEAQLTLLCDWLGLAFDAAMLDAPRLNPLYPETQFRTDKAAAPGEADQRHGAGAAFAELWARYDMLLKRAL
jgi:hypothetical protein